jgi:mono/diheme cytochrome c family protein
MNRTRALTSLSMFLVGGTALAVATLMPATLPAQNSNTATDAANYKQLMQMYCVGCHSGPTPFAGLNLEPLDPANLTENGVIWEKMIRKLRDRQMPPAGMPRPDEATYDAFFKFLESGRDRLAQAKPNPGRTTLNRLNRTEYANTIRDLLAINVDVADLLPGDDIGYGFDNIGDVLSVSPVLLERYLAAAGKIARAAVGDANMAPTVQSYSVPHGLIQTDRMSEALPVGSRGGTVVRHRFPVDGEYEIAINIQRGRAEEYLGLGSERTLDLRLDDQRLGLYTIPANPGRSSLGRGTPPDAHLKARLVVKAGTHEVAASFLKDTVVPEGIIDRGREDQVRTYFEGVGEITVSGPYNVQGTGATASREKIFSCLPKAASEEQACAQQILASVARRAFRRPVTDDDIKPLLTLYQQGSQASGTRGGFENGVRLALQGLLVTPDFIFRPERDPAGAAPGTAHRVSDVELASRLSFFLWSSIPDDELVTVAQAGKLSDKAVLEAQVRRMLADPRSDQLTKNFAGQWLYLRNIERIAPATEAFPNFDENLRQSMAKETELLVDSTMREDRSIVDMLKTDYTFLNQRMAEHYGIKGIYGTEFRRVALEDKNRWGLLGQASVLTVTSYPNRTAPTIRGKWVLQQLLGTPPPPPPPNVPSLKDDEKTQRMTMRQRMELHRQNPTCAVCHRMMDPLGFALDNFDGLGTWRTFTGINEPIDNSGVMPDGTKFEGPAGLREILLSKKQMFVETFTEQLMTYAMGRGVEEYDHPALRTITRQAALQDYRWSSIIFGIVNSTPFQMRRVSDGNN